MLLAGGVMDGGKAKELRAVKSFLKNINRINDIDICEIYDEVVVENKNGASYTVLSITKK